jgi:hypothetical protein
MDRIFRVSGNNSCDKKILFSQTNPCTLYTVSVPVPKLHRTGSGTGDSVQGVEIVCENLLFNPTTH